MVMATKPSFPSTHRLPWLSTEMSPIRSMRAFAKLTESQFETGVNLRDSRKRPPHRHSGAASGLWIYGLHPVRAALANKRRKLIRAVLTARAADEIGHALLVRVKHEIVEIDAVGRLLP